MYSSFVRRVRNIVEIFNIFNFKIQLFFKFQSFKTHCSAKKLKTVKRFGCNRRGFE